MMMLSVILSRASIASPCRRTNAKRCVFALILLLNATVAQAAVTYVNVSTYKTASGTESSSTVAAPASVNNGDFLVSEAGAVYTGGGPAPTITCPTGWTAIDSAGGGLTANRYWSAATCYIALSGTPSYVWNYNHAIDASIVILHYSGANQVDGHALTGPTTGSGTTSQASPTVTTSLNGDSIVQIWMSTVDAHYNQASSLSGAPPPTEVANFTSPGAVTYQDPTTDAAYESQTSAGTTTARTATVANAT
jgi:hypothetical protein